jgi:hypothetical protein
VTSSESVISVCDKFCNELDTHPNPQLNSSRFALQLPRLVSTGLSSCLLSSTTASAEDFVLAWHPVLHDVQPFAHPALSVCPSSAQHSDSLQHLLDDTVWEDLMVKFGGDCSPNVFSSWLAVKPRRHAGQISCVLIQKQALKAAFMRCRTSGSCIQHEEDWGFLLIHCKKWIKKNKAGQPCCGLSVMSGCLGPGWH